MLLRFKLAWLLSFAVMVACALFVFVDRAQAEEGLASWYGPGFEGQPTASGQPYDPNGYTAAHKTLPLGTKLIVSYEGRSIPVTVTDRGPYMDDRELDLSYGAAKALGLIPAGVDEVDYTIAPNGSGTSYPTTQGQPNNTVQSNGMATPNNTAQPNYTDGVSYGTGYLDPSQSNYSIYSDPAVLPANPDAYPVAQPAAEGGLYMVQPGDTLSQIATQLGTTTDYLARYNGITDPNLIYGGQTLYYPTLQGTSVEGTTTPTSPSLGTSVGGTTTPTSPSLSGYDAPLYPMGS